MGRQSGARQNAEPLPESFLHRTSHASAGKEARALHLARAAAKATPRVMEKNRAEGCQGQHKHLSQHGDEVPSEEQDCMPPPWNGMPF